MPQPITPQPVTPLSSYGPQPITSTQPDQITPDQTASASAPPSPASAAPTADAVKPAPPVPSPGAPVAPKTQSQVPTNPQEIHQSVFKSVLGIIAGGGNRPVRNPDGSYQTNPDGTVKMAPASTKQLGASILAGALSSMVASMATPDKYTTFGSEGYQRHVADNSGAVAAGAQAAGKFTQEGTQNEAQKKIDEDSARKMATTDHNLKMHQMLIANDKADAETQQDSVDDWQELNDTMEEEESKGGLIDASGNPISSIYKAKDISPEQLHEMMSSKDPTVHVASDMVSPSKVVQVLGDDGIMHPKTMFNVFNPDAMLAMTDELRMSHPELQHAVGRVPVRVLATAALNENQGNLAKSGLSDQLKGYDSANKSKLADTFDLKAAAAKDPLIQKLYPLINKYRKDSLTAMFNDIEKDPAFAKNSTVQAASAHLQKAMGITPEGLRKQANAEVEATKGAAKGPGGEPVDQKTLDATTKNMASLHPHLTPAQQVTAKSLFYQGMTNDNYKKATDDVDAMEKNNIAANNQNSKLSSTELKDLLNEGMTAHVNDAGETVNKTLDISNAAPEMMVDQRTGQPVPYKLVTSYKPTPQEVNRKDFASTVLSTMDTLKAMQAAHTLPNGPLTGLTAEMLAKAGMASADAQKAIGTIAFMQTAATGAHVAGRFSVPVLDKMSKLIKLNMNDDQFTGAMEAMRPVMQHYVANGGGITVAEWRDMDAKDRKELIDHAHETSSWYHPQNTAGGPAVNTQANVNTPPTTMLKDGVNTTFKNGSVWTLKNGTATLVSQGK